MELHLYYVQPYPPSLIYDWAAHEAHVLMLASYKSLDR